jgi:hypothetical protein
MASIAAAKGTASNREVKGFLIRMNKGWGKMKKGGVEDATENVVGAIGSRAARDGCFRKIHEIIYFF